MLQIHFPPHPWYIKLVGWAFSPTRINRVVKEQPVQEYLTGSSGILGQINLET